jgi:hypothetical protein
MAGIGCPRTPVPSYYLAAAVHVDAIAERLLGVLDTGATCEPVGFDVPGFSVGDAYAVLAAIGRRRVDSGWWHHWQREAAPGQQRSPLVLARARPAKAVAQGSRLIHEGVLHTWPRPVTSS